MPTKLAWLLEVAASDPEDARRRKLLNILLVGLSGLSILFLGLVLAFALLNPTDQIETLVPLCVPTAVVLLITLSIYGVNRYVSGPLASTLFIILWMVLLPFVDDPAEVSNGRSLFMFTIPIVIASILLRPNMAFLIAVLSSLIITLFAMRTGELPNIPAILGFYFIALISWLSASTLDKTFKELLRINADLDGRVLERTQALRAVLERERAEASRTEAILEGIADGVVVFDPGSRAIVANPAIARLVDAPAETIMGQRVESWLAHAQLPEPDRQALLRFLTEHSPEKEKLRIRWGKRILAVRAAPVCASGGEVLGKVAVFHDFTNEAEADRLKNDFVAMVSHELRTPINSILGYMEMLHEGFYGPMNDRQSGVIDRVLVRTRRLLSIVNDLLDHAQIEAGEMTVHPRPFRPSELLDHLHGAVESLAGEKGLQLVVNVAEDLPTTLYGDPQRLNQVLINLVHNAVKFTEQGTVQISLSRHDPEHWAIVVKDTGAGIPGDVQAYIFDPFRQVDMDITRKHGGIGLGLTIVKRLVEMMQGEISLSSQVGRGSTFTVILPILVQEQAPGSVRGHEDSAALLASLEGEVRQ